MSDQVNHHRCWVRRSNARVTNPCHNWMSLRLALCHRLAGGDLDEKLFERRVLQADLAERPAVLDHRSGDLLADVVRLLGPDGGGDVFPVGVAVAQDVYLAD